MAKKEPNKFLAPIVIAGITAGFFISAYKFVFAKPKENTTTTATQNKPPQAVQEDPKIEKEKPSQ